MGRVPIPTLPFSGYPTLICGLQAEIIQDPAAYAELDPDMARTLLDQKQAVCALLLFPWPYN